MPASQRSLPQLPAKAWMALALAIGLVVSGLSLLTALNQPWLGFELSPTSGEETLTVTKAKGPAAKVPIGVTIVALESGDQSFTLEPTDLITEPDGLMKNYREYDRFLARQGQLARIQASDKLTLHSADSSSYLIKPQLSGRPLSSLPPDFWVQVIVGFLAWMVSASVFIFRPRQQNARYLLLSGAATLIFTTAAAAYTTRELGFDGELFRWACDVNFLGGSLFAASFVALLLYYPRRIAPRWVGIAVVSLFVLWFVLQQVGTFESMTFARRFLVMLGVLATFVLAAVQWFVTRKEPVARAALQWFLLSWLLGTTLFAVFILLPQMFGVDTSSIQGYAFSLFLLVYGGLAFGILKFRLFDIGSWWRGILTWTGAVLFLVLLDLLFLYGLQLSSEVSLSLALLISGLLWLPFRAWLWKVITGRKEERLSEHFDKLMAIAIEQRDSPEQEEAWKNFLRNEFTALEITPLSSAPESAAVARNGLDLFIPRVVGQSGFSLSHASEGRRLFHQRDLAVAREMCSMLNHILNSLDSYKNGVLQERKRIARDVHDNTMGNLLSALHQGETSSKDDKIRNSIRELRQIINDQPMAEQSVAGFFLSLEAECRQRVVDQDLRFDWESENLNHLPLNKKQLHTLSSITREAVTNVLKHAQATRVTIQIRETKQRVIINVSDDGVGFDSDVAATGHGLKNISSRLAEMGGTLSFESMSSGTDLQFELPLVDE